MTTGTKVHWTQAHPNNVYTIVEDHYGRQFVESAGERRAFETSAVYEGEPTEAHWDAYLARNSWARR